MDNANTKLGLWTLGAAILLLAILFIAVRMSEANEGFYAKAPVKVLAKAPAVLAKAPAVPASCTDGTLQQEYINAVNNYTIAVNSKDGPLMDLTQATILSLSGNIHSTCGFYPFEKGWGNTTSSQSTLTNMCEPGGYYQTLYNNLVAQMKVASLDANTPLATQQQQQQLILGLSGIVKSACGFYPSSWPSTFVPSR